MLLPKLFRPCSFTAQSFIKLQNVFIYQTKGHIMDRRQLSTQGETLGKSSKNWNDAASVLIVAPLNRSEPYSLGYLLVERSRTGKIMPGNWVFPGGNFDQNDANEKWIQLFKDIQNMDITQEKFFKDGAHIPEIYISENESLTIPKQVSLRITAIRETFEEAGILLCRPRKIDPDKNLHNGMMCYKFDQLENKKELQAWQKRVRKNAGDFLEMCKVLDCVPDIRALNDWSNWLTPTIFKPKSRFDTLFYMAVLPELPMVVIDGNEAAKAQWVTPSALLAEHDKGEIRLMPPQIYEFQRLKTLKTIPEIRDRLNIRKEFGIERYFPVIRNASDGTIFILPGDDLYPNPPDYNGSDFTKAEIPNTVKELKEACSNLHRGIAKSDGVVSQFEINVTRYGHMY